MPSGTSELPEWEQVLSAAAHRQEIFPDAVLVGDTAAALHASHRVSRDADHVLTNVRQRFDDILAQLESVAGWKTSRIRRPVQILGSLDGIETGIGAIDRPEEGQQVNAAEQSVERSVQQNLKLMQAAAGEAIDVSNQLDLILHSGRPISSKRMRAVSG